VFDVLTGVILQQRITFRDAARAREILAAVPGCGPWTVEMTMGLALGDPDAVPIGDLHLPSIVAWALAGELRGDDRRMVELLEPFRGQPVRDLDDTRHDRRADPERAQLELDLARGIEPLAFPPHFEGIGGIGIRDRDRRRDRGFLFGVSGGALSRRPAERRS